MEYIDKYLSQELTGDELREFNAELIANPELEEDIELLQEVEQAIQENEVMALRAKLQSIAASQNENTAQDAELVEEVMQSYDFELSEDLSSFNEFKEPVTINDLKAFAESLPILHLAQHKKAEKENIHQFYKEQGQASVSSEEEFMLTPQDEAIFKEIEDALSEKDVLDLRDNLKQIAASIPAHERTSKEIEQYLDQDMEAEILAGFENELHFNLGLAKDVEMYRDINDASSELDIMNLRAALEDIQNTEMSTSRKFEEIEQYINAEMNEDAVLSFDAELSNNPDLAAELKLHEEIDSALLESDIMNLRAKLGDISKDVTEDKGKERSIFIRFPRVRLAVGAVAATLILLLGIAGLLNKSKNVPDAELYSQYYNSYE
ncbi:MAG TPA: hypothetical protein VLM43_15380, partial [Desulfobacterales bacterium]|nr:hypothetical protein [Desulfobacterales bacterium]